MYSESNMETYITIYKIENQWEFAVPLRKLKQEFCINLEGWDGEGDGREVQKGGDMCVPVADGQGGLACCDSWGHKELDTTEWLNWTELMADPCWGLTENNKIL